MGSGTTTSAAGTELVLVGADNGVVVVTADTPLKRLNYFDGKFLRAEDMQAEQDYLRFLVQLSNRAGGSGVVNGFDVALAPGRAAVSIGQGLALDALGRVLLMPIAKTLPLDDLITASAGKPGTLAGGAAGAADFGECVALTPPAATASGQSGDLYLLTVGFLEALCGEEDVFGQICDDACVQRKDRRWRMEGVVLRAVPLTLTTPLKVATSVPVDASQLRNRVASAFFQDERQRLAGIVSGQGLRESATWCQGAQAELGDAVPLAVFSRSGGVTRFLDAWTARRERIDAPPRRYWAWRLSMRPWEVFLAQVLQFQCQLHDLLAGAGDGGQGAGDPCAPKTAALGRAADLLDRLETWHARVASLLTPSSLAGAGAQPFDLSAVAGLKQDLGKLAGTPTGGDRILISGGILELPPAGYLPVDASGKASVDQQVRAFMGPGVDLRYCIVTPDYVPHALEMRQHMDRISLTDGLDDPAARPPVDVLVPGGRIVQGASAAGLAFQARVDVSGILGRPAFGVASAARRGDTGGTFTLAGTAAALQLEHVAAAIRTAETNGPAAAAAPTPAASIDDAHLELARRMAAHTPFAAALGASSPSLHPLSSLSSSGGVLGAVEGSVSVDADPFQLDVSGSTGLNVDLLLGVKSTAASLNRLTGRWTVFPRSRGTAQGLDYQVGTLSGTYVTTDGATRSGHDVVWQYQALRQAGAGAGTVFARILTATPDAPRSAEFDAWYEWQGDPLRGTLKVHRAHPGELATGAAALAHLALRIPDPPTTPPVLAIDLTQDPAVLEPTEQHHVLAESALQVLAALLANGADWQRATEAALFPRPAAGGDVSVLGERDWVLFARRRLSTCADAAVKPTPASRRYHVYVHEAAGDREAAAWLKDLLSENGSLQDARFVGFADLDATTADPLDVPGLRAELAPVKGDALRWIVAASDYGDGVAEEGRRRAHLEAAASPVLDVTAASPVDLGALPAVFRGRIDGGQAVHGAVVLVAVPQRAVANVYAVPEELANVIVLQPQPDGTVVVRDPADLGRFGSRPKFLLGAVAFRNGAPDDAQLQAVVAKWNAQQGFLGQAVVVTRQASDDGAARSELQAVVDAVRPSTGVRVWQSHAASAQDFDTPAAINAMVFLVQAQVILLRRDTPAGGGEGGGGAGGGEPAPAGGGGRPEGNAPTPGAGAGAAAQVYLVRREGVATLRPLLESGRLDEALARGKRLLQPVPDLQLGGPGEPLGNPEVLRKAWRSAGEGPPQSVLTLIAGRDAALAREVRAQSRSVAAAAAGTGRAPPVSVVKVEEGAAAGAAPGAVFHFLLPRG